MSHPSPQLFFETVNAYQRTAALRAGIELEVFTAIGEGAATPAELARRCQASERGLRILCDYLTILGFLTKQDGRYALTPDSAAFLDKRSPAYVGGTVRFLLSPALTSGFQDLAAAVRKGGTAASELGSLAPEHPMWIEFADAMAPLTTLAARVMVDLAGITDSQPCRVLDIAAGHGRFGLAFAERHPHAEVVALDWPNVLEVATANARAAGVDGRFGSIAGSAFEVDYRGPYDIVLLTNFLHHFDLPTCERLLRKVHAVLRPGGRALTLEFVPNDDRVTPPGAAAFSLMMLGSTPAGDAYTFAEYDAMFRAAGFARSELHPLPPPNLQSVLVSEP
jgi:ubiquinone/menaquinone biosynthesis C-methylase UbiE